MNNEIDKKTYIKMLIISLIICIVPILFAYLFYDKFPEELPNRIRFNGTIESYTHKNNILFVLPIIMFFVTIISSLMTYYDPFDKRRSNKNNFLLKIMILFPSLMANLIFWTSYLHSVKNINVFASRIDDILLGVVFIIIGNYMPKNKQNATLGVRTPWTLKDEVNWNKTNRLGGYVFIISGTLFIISSFIKDSLISIIFKVLIMSSLFIPAIYSFYLYKKSL